VLPLLRIGTQSPWSTTFTTFDNEYDVYHDESDIDGFWHGILFVPRGSRDRLLTTVRANTARSHKICLKNVDRDTGKLHKCTSCWLQIGVAGLLQDFKRKAYSIPTGADGRWADYVPMTQLIRARFVLFKVKDGLNSLNLCPDYASKVETTFRMAFKGGLTMFSNEGDELCIRSLHFDGHRHYRRRLDMGRILRGVGNPPQRVRLHDDIAIDDDSSDHEIEGAQSYDDCQLLQLTDLLVSGFRTVLGKATHETHLQLCGPLAELNEKWKRGRKGFSNSRWFKGFCISEGYIDNGEWQFGIVEPKLRAIQDRLF
jgi:hypothetical protein